MRYFIDIQHCNFRLFYKNGTLHLDGNAVSCLLKSGEMPVYLSADDLEWDKDQYQRARDMSSFREAVFCASKVLSLSEGVVIGGIISIWHFGLIKILLNPLRCHLGISHIYFSCFYRIPFPYIYNCTVPTPSPPFP